MADVVLIQPVTTVDDAKGPTLGSMENLGLGYLSSSLKEKAISSRIINAEAQDLDPKETAELALRESPTIVGISPAAINMRGALAIAKIIKDSRPSVTTVLGGHHATLCTEEILTKENPIDFIFRGDAERPFACFAEAVLNGDQIPDIPSLASRQKYANNLEVPSYQEYNLNDLPWPTRPALDSNHKCTETRLITSRGCSFSCSFCTTPNFYRNICWRDIQNIIQEIEYLYNRGIHHIWFNDDLFVIGSREGHKRVREFCYALKKSSADVTFRPMARADSFSYDISLMDELISAGMSHIFIGIESGNETDLTTYRKGVDIETNVHVIKFIKSRTNLIFQMGFIMFNPWSTLDSLYSNLRFLVKVGECYRAFPLFRVLSVFPGTEIWKRLKKEGLSGNVNYKSELPYSYEFCETNVEMLAKLQHNGYSVVSELDNSIYRRTSELIRSGNLPEAKTLMKQAEEVNVVFFRSLLSMVEKGSLSLESHRDELERYKEKLACIIS